MTEKRVQFNKIVKNQLPSYVREEFPLVVEFLSQYYISQEYKGAPVDLIQNIDNYIKLEETTNLNESVVLGSSISFNDETISINPVSGTTDGFPDSYGLIKINDEIITYRRKDRFSFYECVRGFSGISSYTEVGNPEELIFESTSSQEHASGSKIENLSVYFLKEFLKKTKKQILPGFENRDFAIKSLERFPGDPNPDQSKLDQRLFIKQSKDFYSSKGTDQSFKILFNALYAVDVEIIKPKEFLFRPSDAGYRVTNDLVVESISGNPFDLENRTLFQDRYKNITNAYAPVSKVEKLDIGIGTVKYYKISLDSGYDRDIRVDGSIYGKFSIHTKTKTIGQVSIGQTYIDVDSTLGFPSEGELLVTYPNQQTGVISYTSKTLTQFSGCSAISFTIPDNTTIDINTFAYSNTGINTSDQIRVKIRSVLNSLNVEEESSYHLPGESIKIKTLGVKSSDKKSNNWYFNVSSSYNAEKIQKILDNNYRVTLFDSHLVRVGDRITIQGSDGRTYNDFKITNILNNKTFDCQGSDISNLGNSQFIIKKQRIKTNSSIYNINNEDANVQNVYKLGEKTLIASGSLPFYTDSSQNPRPINTKALSYNLNGIFPEGDIIRLTSTEDHGFYTGDSVYYTPQKTNDGGIISSLFDEGIYYVLRVDTNNIKLARSRSNIFNEIFVELESDREVSNNKIELLRFKGKSLANQKILREISNTINDGKLYPTLPGQTGILVNGVEILNYKSKDSIYYGNIENIEVVAGGENYDVVNVPRLIIKDSVGTGATGYVSVKGKLDDIKIIDSGFDYLSNPTIQISGGNGSGATAEAILTDTIHQVSFNSEQRSALVNLSNNTIGFTTYHKFRNNESIVYKTFSQQGISGLSTDSTYFVSVQDSNTIKLYKTYDDSVSGINTISLVGYGVGNHVLEAVNKKKIVSSIVVTNSGDGYENKLRTCSPVGINTSLNLITIKDHGYRSGEIVKYSIDGVGASGLTTLSSYYVTAVDDNNFKLSNVGLTTSDPEFYYRTKQYANITSSGIGTHIFNYPEISVNVVGRIGISSVTGDDFKCKVQPIFKGEITSVHLSKGGSNYGSNIINYKKEPVVEVDSGFGASFTPIIVDGKISEVLINNGGYSYTSPPELVVVGEGSGAKLTSILTNGRITSVIIVDAGAGYNQYSTNVRAIPSGSGVKFVSNIKSWNINLFERYKNIFRDDDGVIADTISDNYGLEYCHIFAPRGLRRSSYSIDSQGNTLYQEPDLKLSFSGKEIDSENHSPIIGWAYDGNPIYGPYGYSSKTGGSVVRLKSSYVISPKAGRPPLSIFPEGFFVEDYQYVFSENEEFLDENNGRFCKTPDFPDGTYAYFATFDDSIESDGIFVNLRKPVFPYIIGKNYRSRPNQFNFNINSNQDEYDLNDGKWLRNTFPYNFDRDNSFYDYVLFPNKLKEQTSKVVTTQVGSIESIGIDTGGSNYKINDKILLDLRESKGKGFSANVSRISGKKVNYVSVSSTSITGVEFYTNTINRIIGVCSSPHTLNDFDLIKISGLNTTSSSIEGTYRISVPENKFSLSGVGTTSLGISSTGVTGIVTFISVEGSLDFSEVRENDILKIENEKLKVLNVDEKSSRIRVLREFDGTIGVSHSAGVSITEDSRKFLVNVGYNTYFPNLINRELYFNPQESLGIGSIFGVGISSTIVFSNPGSGKTQIFIPTKSIYLPNHNLKTGDSVSYRSNGGSSIGVSTDGITSTNPSDGDIFYIAKITDDLVGISSVKVGLGSTGSFVGIGSTNSNQSTLYFTGFGTNVYHSFNIRYPEVLTGRIDKNLVTVSTSETHGLKNYDSISIDVNPSIERTFSVKYNEYNRRIIIGEKEFTSLDVNIELNSIRISKHGFSNGQVVIHNSNAPAGGLENNKIYYVYVVDDDTIKLTNSQYESLSKKPNFVEILSSSSGKLSLVNPPIIIHKNSPLVFDLTDGSLAHISFGSSVPSFEMDIFVDENFTNKYEKIENSELSVQKIGTVGVSTNAKLILTTNKNTPKTLTYNFSPVNLSSIPEEKKEIIVDNEVYKNNTIFVKNSIYSGDFNILVSSSSTSFTYDLDEYPENDLYTEENSIISYDTNSLNVKGPIKDVKILDGGYGFDVIPGVSTVISSSGSGAILTAESSSIGLIKKTRIQNIGFDYPSDFTLRPTAKIAEVLDLKPLSSFDSIGVTTAGIGYVVAPELIVIDGLTNKQVNDVDLRYNISDDTVTILKNTKGLFELEPTILPIRNCNGVGISSISYDSITDDVTVNLSVGFTTASGFPFSVNDRILIENISIQETQPNYKGYNSKDYNYSLFVIKNTNPDYGGSNASITYNISEFLSDVEEPGTFDPIESSGRVIPEKYFPKFNTKLTKNIFYEGESVETIDGSSSGRLYGFNDVTEKAIVETTDDFEGNNILVGSSSGSQALIVKSSTFNSNYTTYKLDSFSRVLGGWSYDAGVLNDNKQRISDNFYYQNFSYSLKSTIDYDTWNDVVSNLNHTAGFKKFSDYQLESTATNPTSLVVGISTELTNVDLKIDLVSVIDLNCVSNFDLASENALNISSDLVSDEIIFTSAILTDYLESFGNRVLLFDDISGKFNSNPSPIRYSIVHRTPFSDIRTQKYFIFTKDAFFTDERQLTIATFLIDNDNNSYLNQYGIYGPSDLGSYDVSIDGSDIILQFFPNKYLVNNYDTISISYSLKDTLTSVGSSHFGPVSLASSSVFVSTGSTTTIVGIASTYISSKILVEMGTPDGLFQYDEITLIHNNSEVSILEFGSLNNISGEYVGPGLGTYNAYISGSNINLDFSPNPGIAATVNLVSVSIGDTSSSGIGTYQMKHVLIEGSTTSIASSTSPTAHDIASFSETYDAAYFIVQISDITNNRHQVSELLVIEEDAESITYQTEFGNVETNSGLGTIGSYHVHPIETNLTFTPLPNIDVVVKVYMNAFVYTEDDNLPDQINLNNSIIETDFSEYFGTETNIKREFELTHKGYPVFVRDFLGNDTRFVSTTRNHVIIPNHFFVTGEELLYTHAGYGSTMSIGIATTSIIGIGTTDKLPSTIYAIKVDDKTLKFASSVENALKAIPETLNITHVGIGTSHTLTAKNQNSKVLITLDNNIQSPVVSTSQTTSLAKQARSIDDTIFFSGITSFFGGDLVKIDNEILRIDGVGIGSTNAIRVKRSWMGTPNAGYSTGALVTKITGNYNIVGNKLNFVSAPYGNIPLSTTSNSPDSRDWSGISTSSKFHGRMFMRSGELNGVNDPYYKNYIFDDISESFTGITSVFTLTSSRSNITGISTSNAIVLINEIFQNIGFEDSYVLTESGGQTNIEFVGTARTFRSDVGISTFPRGGMIVSVGSSAGFGYQPLVSAGGTAIVSVGGTIQSISIGNSGSGYRQIQNVNVGVTTSTTGIPNVHFIGTAIVSNGSIVSVAITNPGFGYTSSNPPYVVFDDPLSYSNIPLIYSNNSSPGIGTSASINVVVGQGSSIIDFEIQSTGYAYGQGETLTLPIGGVSGIPTTFGYVPFELTIEKTINDKFSGWSIGELQVLDNFDEFFNGRRRSFYLKFEEEPVSILAAPGSNIDVKQTLLIFINDILQIPGESYNFNGGNIITFTEAPKEGDTSKVIFYRGSGDIDVIEKSVIDSVKVGDTLTLNYSPTLNQPKTLQENKRVVTEILGVKIAETNPYYGPGNIDNPDLLRPVTFCRQTEDVIINSKIVGKSRELYEANINPFAYLTRSVGAGQTEIFVDNVRPFFNPINETNEESSISKPDPLAFQREIVIISQDSKVSASATAIVSVAGTISSVVISEGGVGYTTSPSISIAGIGVGATITAEVSTIISNGSLISIEVTNPGFGYTTSNPPKVLIESPTTNKETNKIESYEGDFGIITGISTTSVGVASTGLVFDLAISKESFLRDSNVTGVTTISGIQTSYYFVVYDSNVGNGVTSLESDNSVLGIGTMFLDNVYKVSAVSVAQTDVIGLGVTYVAKVVVSISDYNSLSGIGISSFYGRYSWGRLSMTPRLVEDTDKTYNAYLNNGVTGIKTGAFVSRIKPLRYQDYIL